MDKDYAGLAAELNKLDYAGLTDSECLAQLPVTTKIGYVTINDAVNHDARYGVAELMSEIAQLADEQYANSTIDAITHRRIKREARVFGQAIIGGVLPKINVGDATTQFALTELVNFGGPDQLYTQAMRDKLESMAEQLEERLFPWATERDIYLARLELHEPRVVSQANDVTYFDVPVGTSVVVNGEDTTSCGYAISKPGKNLKVFCHYENNMPYPVNVDITIHECPHAEGQQHLAANYVKAMSRRVTIEPGEVGASFIIRRQDVDRYVRVTGVVDMSVDVKLTLKSML